MPAERKNILFYCGGFQPVGGVESFTIDLINGLPPELASVSLALWSEPLTHIPALAPIRAMAAGFYRSGVRWGCTWDVPDRLLVPKALPMARRAGLLVFAKVMSQRVHRTLRKVCGRDGRPIPSVLVTPYRPREMWPGGATQELLDCFDVITVQAPAFAEDLAAMNYRGRVEVLYLIPPAASPLSAGKRTDGGIRLGFLGRLVPAKNVDYLLEIFSRLSTPAEPYELHVFGDGTQRAELEAKARKLPAAGRIHFHGVVSGAAKWEAIDSCDLFLITSLTEGQCLVALEVLSRGRPLAATPVGALPHIIDSPDSGTLIPLKDAAAAATLVAATAQRWKTGELSPARIRARYDARFSREKIIAGYARLFGELLERGSGR